MLNAEQILQVDAIAKFCCRKILNFYELDLYKDLAPLNTINSLYKSIYLKNWDGLTVNLVLHFFKLRVGESSFNTSQLKVVFLKERAITIEKELEIMRKQIDPDIANYMQTMVTYYNVNIKIFELESKRIKANDTGSKSDIDRLQIELLYTQRFNFSINCTYICTLFSCYTLAVEEYTYNMAVQLLQEHERRRFDRLEKAKAKYKRELEFCGDLKLNVDLKTILTISSKISVIDAQFTFALVAYSEILLAFRSDADLLSNFLEIAENKNTLINIFSEPLKIRLDLYKLSDEIDDLYMCKMVSEGVELPTTDLKNKIEKLEKWINFLHGKNLAAVLSLKLRAEKNYISQLQTTELLSYYNSILSKSANKPLMNESKNDNVRIRMHDQKLQEYAEGHLDMLAPAWQQSLYQETKKSAGNFLSL